MKKIIFFAFVLFASIALMGCGETGGTTPGGGGEGGGGTTTDEYENKFNTISQYINDNIPYIITEDIELITEYPEYNAIVEWSSSNEDVMSFTGGIAPDKSKATEVELTYKVLMDQYENSGVKKVIVSPITIDNLFGRFEKQFSKSITRDYDVKDEFYDLFKVNWYSTDESLFDNNGKYYKPRTDKDFEIKYTIKCNEFETEERSIKLTAIGQSDLEKVEEIKNWIANEVLTDLYLTDKVSLPNYYEPLNVKIEWKSSNEDVVSKDGVVTQYVFERYVTLIASYQLGNGSGGSSRFECIVEALDTSKMSEEEILENFLSAIALNYYGGIRFGGNGNDCNQTYGHLNFYVNEESNVIQNLIPIGLKNRTQIKQDVKLIVCHDTGNMSAGATSKANSDYVKSGYSGSSTGWHYTVGNDGVFQTVPDDEVAYQANGSANQYTTFIKTNVKATWKKPNFSVSSDEYIMINNQKTNIKLPKSGVKLASDGPVWQVSSDGYYEIAKLWYCESHGYNATQGGNANAIGIESAVNSGSDYLLTCRIFAKLVAELVIKHDLNLYRVVQHNTTSGKDCPNAMRATDFWYTFKDMISLEKFAKENLSQFNFTWTGSSDIDNTGRIKKGTTASEVTYSVAVTKVGESSIFFGKSYTTKIN